MVNYVFIGFVIALIFLVPMTAAFAWADSDGNVKIIKRNRSNYLALLTALFLVFMFIPLSSANIFSDAWGKITGKATSGTASVNITVGNSAPSIAFVTAVSAQTPLELGYRSVLLNFSVNDSDGAANINISSARVQFNRTGETTRTNYTCADLGAGGTGHMFTCNVSMYYYDEIGTWTINVSARDNNEAGAENSTSNFTYNLLTAMVLSPTSLTWATIGLADVNQSSSNDPISLNNTGNSANGTINTTAYNLRGETTTTQFIFANNFTIGNVTDGCGAGINASTLSNATSKRLNGTNFSKGNNTLNHGNQTSGQEQLFVCLRGVPQDASAQSYSSSFYGPWVVEVIV